VLADGDFAADSLAFTTMGYILLAGGAEFGGGMALVDRRAIELAGGSDAPMSIVPAAAAPDKNHERAGQKGVDWFKKLGAVDVTVLPLIDRKSADNMTVVKALLRSRLIYMLGGFPRHLEQSLAGSDSWQAILTAHQCGAVIAGSSAGAMILCEHYYDPFEKKIFKGLGWIPNACVLPHHNTFGGSWSRHLGSRLGGVILIGIDEKTGMINDGPEGQWQVYGTGRITRYRNGRIAHFDAGKPFDLMN
jgi:cyanophycinase